MTVLIRKARMEDATAIARVHVESWRSTYRGLIPDEYLDSLDAGARAEMWKQSLEAHSAVMLVAEDDLEVVGFACGGRLREPIKGYKDAELYAIYLLLDRQRKGIGRRLTNSLVQALRDVGNRSLIVWALARNPAVDFYRRLGALPVASKTIEIGGAQLEELALGWPDLDRFFPEMLLS
jgi:GNAT superfamily N-acetyltransferase